MGAQYEISITHVNTVMAQYVSLIFLTQGACIICAILLCKTMTYSTTGPVKEKEK